MLLQRLYLAESCPPHTDLVHGQWVHCSQWRKLHQGHTSHGQSCSCIYLHSYSWGLEQRSYLGPSAEISIWGRRKLWRHYSPFWLSICMYLSTPNPPPHPTSHIRINNITRVFFWGLPQQWHNSMSLLIHLILDLVGHSIEEMEDEELAFLLVLDSCYYYHIQWKKWWTLSSLACHFNQLLRHLTVQVSLPLLLTPTHTNFNPYFEPVPKEGSWWHISAQLLEFNINILCFHNFKGTCHIQTHYAWRVTSWMSEIWDFSVLHWMTLWFSFINSSTSYLVVQCHHWTNPSALIHYQPWH